MKLDPFYPIVPDFALAARLVPLGVKFLQLRIKDAPAETIRAEIAQTMQLCAEHDCLLVVNDYWREAIDLGADFIHLGQEDLAAADLGAIKRAGLKLGISSHSPEELGNAKAAEPDYVALGPVYETKLKKMPWAPQGLDRIREWRSALQCPLVAIGGITVERAAGVLEAGADSAAVITDILTDAAPEARARQWIAATQGWRANS
ncbi:Thiamine-phosphate synthase [Methyloligella halotolerans]|uniref:Thiamine-phosphate synthase n=1 Tax=Methyloligella halotolerans TaxID=1177755 RepID=A0A1E2RZC2_9HYPH|nr:thiamine phosphate synthase [Methyloligella halotolerans]ODA67455.1 Thiamine-phosphate synthase [Methyloligella halotolerans]